MHKMKNKKLLSIFMAGIISYACLNIDNTYANENGNTSDIEIDSSIQEDNTNIDIEIKDIVVNDINNIDKINDEVLIQNSLLFDNNEIEVCNFPFNENKTGNEVAYIRKV